MAQVKGHVEYDGRRLDQPQLAGKWDEALSAVSASGAQQLLWARNPPHDHPSRCAHIRPMHQQPINVTLSRSHRTCAARGKVRRMVSCACVRSMFFPSI